MKKLVIFLSVIFLIGLVSAGLFDYNSPRDLLDNEWIVFGGVFLLIFALVYMALTNFFNRKKKGWVPWEEKKVLSNQPAIVIMSLIVSLFGASTFARRSWMIGYIGEEIGSWVLFIFAIFILLIIFKLVWKYLGKLGVILGMVATWTTFHYIDAFDVLPYNFPYQLFDIYDLVFGFVGLVVVGIISLIIMLKGKKWTQM